jgi:hypothetical protein
LAEVIAEASDCTDVLFDLLQMFRDKKPVFNLCCELLCRLVLASEKVKKACNGSDFRRRIEGIQQILERRHRVDSRVKAVGRKSKHHGDGTRNAEAQANSPEKLAEIFEGGGLKGKMKMLEGSEPVMFMRYLMGILA